jgi:AcrR family transcriptional regulator
MGRHSDNARERIIDAAERLVMEAGTRHLTLDAVASKAGISRGGLLYHFPDKEALLKGMLGRRMRLVADSRTSRRAQIPEGPEREAVAFVLTCLDENAGENRVGAAILAAGAQDPELLAPAREEYRQLMADLTKDGLSFERAAVIALATNGLRFLDVLSICPFDEKERCAIVEELMALAKGE